MSSDRAGLRIDEATGIDHTGGEHKCPVLTLDGIPLTDAERSEVEAFVRMMRRNDGADFYWCPTEVEIDIEGRHSDLRDAKAYIAPTLSEALALAEGAEE